MKLRLKVFPIILLIISSCVSIRTKEALDRAESLMTEAPDSALAIVHAIDRDNLKTHALQARHALLLTMAQDKCIIDVKDDSTIRLAYNYYHKYGSSLDRLLSSYYLGLVQQNNGNDIGAVIALREAEPLAETLGEYRWQSLCDQHLCAVYSRNYDRLSAMTYAKKSLEAAEKAGEPLMAGYCQLDIAAQYLAQSQNDQAEVLFRQLLIEYEDNGPLYSYAARMLAKLYLFKKEPEYEKADSLYSAFIKKGAIPLSGKDYVYLGLIAEHKGERDKADQYCLLSEQMMKTQSDSLTYHITRTNLFELRGDSGGAYSSYEKAMTIQDRIVSAQLEQSISHGMEGYFLNQAEQEKERGRNRLHFAILAGALLVGIIAWLTVRLHRAKRETLEKMAQIHDFSRDLENLQSKNTASRSLLNHYVKDKIQSLNSLADAYFSWDSDYVRQKERRIGDRTKEELVETFQKQLETFRKDTEFYSALENGLNMSYDNIMVRAREELKREKKVDFDLVNLYFAGFPAKSICFLKNMTEASVRMRKSRLKLFFASLPDHRGDEFVKILERKD
ncbi:MAG: hypothetical protein IKV62_05885 [Bacteroidales bacterium]|nr:hypothetical protein [Bacteroidales bacterium]